MQFQSSRLKRLVGYLTGAFLMGAIAPAAVHAAYPNDPWDSPDTYISGLNLTQTGATLRTTLGSWMANGHQQTTYGEARYILDDSDQDPNNPNNVLLVYSRTTISGTWDNGASWTREHVWPNSRQPGSAGNSTFGSQGDVQMLKPINQDINSTRGNDPFYGPTTTGNYHSPAGGQWYPGDADAGDIARICFYAATRWSSVGLTLVNGTNPTGYQMGDLNSMLHWNYRDTPDTFEVRRQQVIATGYDLNGNYAVDGLSGYTGTHNRNLYVDHPEYAWAAFTATANDTQLYVGTPAANGSSALDVDLGRVIMGQAGPGAQNVALHKTGNAGTYFNVDTTGNATSSITGHYNAFEMDSSGSRSLAVGLNSGTSTTGVKSGSVIIDNLDIDTRAASGKGVNDGNDTINVHYAVVSKRQVSASAVDLGTAIVGADLNGTATLSTFGSDNERTRVNVAATSSTDSNGAQVNSGSGTSFNSASSTGTRNVHAHFNTAGAKSGSLGLAVTSQENLISEGSYANVNVGYTATILDHANASFETADVNTKTINFGTFQVGSGIQHAGFSIYNLLATAGYTAKLDMIGLTGSGDTGTFPTNLNNPADVQDLTTSQLLNFLTYFDTSSPGNFSATYTFDFSDDTAIPGATGGQVLTLTLNGTVTAVPEPTSIGLLTLGGLTLLHRHKRAGRPAR